MAIIDSQVHVYEANTPKRPWHNVPNWPDHVTGDEMVAAMDKVGVDSAIFISAFSMYRYQCRGMGKQQRLERGVIALRRERPAQTRGHRALHVLGDRSLGHPHGGGNALVTQTRLELQAENFLNLAHGFPLGRHPSPDKKSGRITRLS